MTASHPGPGQLFLGSTLGDIDFHRRPSNFLCSFLFHAAFIALIWLLARSVSPVTPAGINARAWQAELPIIFRARVVGVEAAKICCPHLEVRCHVRGLMSNLFRHLPS